MNIFGGSLGTYPDTVLVDYPRRNVETFANAFFQSCQYMTGEAWSTTMYWYMEHSDYPEFVTGFFFVSTYEPQPFVTSTLSQPAGPITCGST
jgi:hypothetical protein